MNFTGTKEVFDAGYALPIYHICREYSLWVHKDRTIKAANDVMHKYVSIDNSKPIYKVAKLEDLIGTVE